MALCEKEVCNGMYHGGRGDLIFRFSNGMDFVVEVKKINSIGGTIKIGCTQKRNKVKKQATKYGEIWLRHRTTINKVAVAIFTKESGLTVRDFNSDCWKRFQK
jgi:hydrogenase maturation factor